MIQPSKKSIKKSGRVTLASLPGGFLLLHVDCHRDLVAGVELRTAPTVRPHLAGEVVPRHGAEAEAMEEPLLQRQREPAPEAETAGLRDEPLHEPATDPRSVHRF